MKKKSGKRHVILWILFSLVVVASVVTIVVNFSGDKITTNKIAIIPLKGAISTENGGGDFFRPGTIGSGSVIDFIEAADKDANVKAIILNINSPGGTVVASKEIADAVKAVDKPVVALIREVGASGAYWVASASDVIVADPLSITGSIGVIGSYLEFSDLFSEYGIGYQSLTTGEFKDLGSPYKKLSPSHEKILLGKLQIIHDYFVDDVSKNRGLDLTEFGNGLFYLGVEAQEIGLVDQLGGKDEAIEVAKNLAGIEEYELQFYQHKRSFLDILSSVSSDFGFNIGQGFGDSLLAEDEFDISLR